MEAAERRWSVEDEDPLAASDGSGEWICQRSERRRHSMLKRAESDPKLKLLAEDSTFPNISKRRQQWLREVFFYGYYLHQRGLPTYPPLPIHPVEEYGMRAYLDAESPIYTQSFVDVPSLGVGKRLNVFDFLGDNLLSFNTSSSQSLPSIQPTKSTGNHVGPGPDRGFRPGKFVRVSGMGTPVKGSPNAPSSRPPKLRSGVIASPSSTTLREDDAKVESTLNLKGKYVMICCFFVPSLWSSSDESMIYHTALASHELAERDDFVFVVVPMMRKGFTHSSSAYQQFLSAFSCLAVPFHDILRREYICSALGFDGVPKALILDPSQKVLYHGPPDMFCLFGPADPGFFPFTPEQVMECSRRDSVAQFRSLDEFLCLGDTDVLYDIEYLAGGGLKEDGRITVSELKQKLVGIYVCSDATNLAMLQKVYGECKRKEYQLEIVVACFPFHERVPPKTEEKFIIDAFASLGLLHWWFLPFNNTVCHRLKRMHESHSMQEGLFMVDPIRKYVDPYVMPIICDFGVDGYPFTRRKLVEKEVERKMGLTVNSLLLPWTHVCCKKPDSGGSTVMVPVSEALKNKIVVLYLYEEVFKSDARKLVAWYKNNIKGKVSNVEVVTTSMDGTEGSVDEEFLDMGWLVCPADRSKAARVRDEYCHPCCWTRDILVVFGEDGRIQCVDDSLLLESHGLPPRGGGNNLRDQVARQFGWAGFEYIYGIDSP